MSVENSESRETSLVDSTTTCTDPNVWSMMESAAARMDDLREITPSISPVFTEDQVRELTQQASDMELLLAHDTFKRINERMDALTPEQTSLLIATTASPFDHDVNVTYTDVLTSHSDPPSDPDHYPIVSSHGHDILFNEGLRLDLPVGGIFPFGNIAEVCVQEESTLAAEQHREPSSTSEEKKTETPREPEDTEIKKVSDQKENDTKEKEIENKEVNEKEVDENPSGSTLRRSPRKQTNKSEKPELPEKRQLRTRGAVRVEEKEKPGAQKQEETNTELRRSPRAKGSQNLSESEEWTSAKGRGKKAVQSEKQGKEDKKASEQGKRQPLRNKQKGVVPEDAKNVRRSPRIQHKPIETEQEKSQEKKTGRKKKEHDEQSRKDNGPEVVEGKKEKQKEKQKEAQKEKKEIKSKKEKVCSETEAEDAVEFKGDERKGESVEQVHKQHDGKGNRQEKNTLAGKGQKQSSPLSSKVQPWRTKARRSSRIAHAVEEQHKKEEKYIIEEEKVKTDDKEDTHSSHGIENESKTRETSTVAEVKDAKVVQKEPRKKQTEKQNVELNGAHSEDKKTKKQNETVKGKKTSVSPHSKEVNQKKVVQKQGSFGNTKSHDEGTKKDEEQVREQMRDVEGIDERKKKDKDLSKKVQKEKGKEEKDRKEKVKIADESLKKTKQTDVHKGKDMVKNSKQVEILKGKESEVEKSEATTDKVGEEKPRRESASRVKNIVKELTSGELSDEESESGDDNGDAEMGGDSDYDPDNDPDRVWCICRKPHGNRFMICCDGCEEWFHGDCVGITMALGRQMEKEGHEYICPKCKQKQGLESTEQPQPKGEQQYKEALPRKRKLKIPVSPEEQLRKKAKRLKKKRQSKDRDRGASVKMERKEREHASWKARLESDKLIQEGLIAKPEEQVERKRRLSSSSSAESAGFKIPKKVRTTPTPAGYTTHMQRVCIRIGCKRSAEKGSVFCCDDCIVRHADHSLKLLAEQRKKHIGYKSHTHKPVTSPTSNVLSPWETLGHPFHSSSEHKERIAVVEKTSGRVIAGMTAPTETDLVSWLQRHPTFEVLLPTAVKEEKKPEKKPDKKDEEHNIRDNVKRALKEILSSRSRDTQDISVSTEEISKYANGIEDEMYKYFGDTGHRYKNKYRSLIFNLKDTRNKVLVLHVLSGEATADRLVRMTPEQLASQELTMWREREAKHTLEMIKKDQEEMAHAKAHMVKKTHKGEVEVNEEDLSSLESHAKEGSDLPDSSNPGTGVLLIDTTEEHRIHLFDLNCRICTGRTIPPGEPPKRDPAVPIVSTTTTIQALAESSVPSPPPLDMSSPDSGSVSSALPLSPPPYSKPTKRVPAVWKGFVMMQNVAKFGTNAYCVSGPCDDLLQLLPDTIHVQGRIKHEQVWDYIFQLKSSSSRDVCVIRYEASSEEEKTSCVSLYSYFQSRRRCGVVGNCYTGVKDMYLVPLAAHERVPRELLPFNGPGLDEPRPHMLLGIIVRVKAPVKRHRSLSQRLSSSPPKKRTSTSSASESLPSTTQSPLRDSPVAEIDDIVFQYNTNQNKKPVTQTTYSPSANTPPSMQSTPSESSGTPSVSSGAVSSPVSAPAVAKPTSSLVALEAQKLQLLELQEKAKQCMLEIQQKRQRGSAAQDSIAPLSQFPLPPTFALPQLPLPQSKIVAPLLQEQVTQSSQNVAQSAQVVAPEVQPGGLANEDAPYDPEEDLDLALEDAMAKETPETEVEQSTSVPVVPDTKAAADSSTVYTTASNQDAFKDAFPRLQATLNALGIPCVPQGGSVSKLGPERGEPKRRFSEPAPRVGLGEVPVSSQADPHVVKVPPEHPSTDHEKTQRVPQMSTDHHHFSPPPIISRQVSGMRQNPQGPESFRMMGHPTERRHSQEESTRGSVAAKDRGYREPRFRDDHRPAEHPAHRSEVRQPPDHMSERSRIERADSRYPHDVRPRDPPGSWRDPRGPRDSRDAHDARYTRDPHDSGYDRDRYRGRHEDGEYRDYPDRFRGRDDYDHGGYGRGEQPRRRSWEEPRYEGYRRERWRR